MGFSFSGMMRGLGAGLVNSGTILADKAKRDWEEQQLMLKLEREEHMERLRLQNQRDLQKENLSFTGEQNRLTREQEAGQFKDTMRLKQQELAMQEKELAANTDIRRQSLAIQQQEADKKSIQERMYEDQKAAVDAVAQKAYPDDPDKQEVFKFQLMYGKDKNGQQISGETAKIATETATTYISDLKTNDPDAFQRKKEELDLRDKSDEEAAFIMTQFAASDFAEKLTGTHSSNSLTPSQGNSTDTTTETPLSNSVSTLDTIKNGSKEEALQALAEVKRAASDRRNDPKKMKTLLDQANRLYQSRTVTTTRSHNLPKETTIPDWATRRNN